MKKLSEKDKRALSKLLLCGARLSNVAYNLRYRTEFTDHDRASCKESYQNWDAALSKLPKWMRKI